MTNPVNPNIPVVTPTVPPAPTVLEIEDAPEVAEKFEHIELTPEQDEMWKSTMAMLSWRAPGFQYLWYKMLCHTHNAGGAQHRAVMTRNAQRCPVAATDGQNMLLNPDTYFKLGLQERVFVAAHEIVHNVYGDVEFMQRCAATGVVPQFDGTTVPFDEGCMQRSMDYRINALLKDSKIGALPSGEFKALYDTDIATGESSILDAYKRLWDRDGPSGTGLYGHGGNVLPPGNGHKRNQSQWQQEVAVARTLEAARSQGNMAAALKRLFKDILDPEVPWTDYVKSFFDRTVGSGNYDWTRGDRRYLTRDVFLPSSSGYGANWIVVWGDTSGSRSDKEIASSIAELSQMVADIRPRRLTVLWGDADIANIQELMDGMDLKDLDPQGGGGTDVIPVLMWIDDQMQVPDLFVGFTDGYLSFPKKAPHYPVLWCSSTDEHYPWGEVVRVMKPTRLDNATI